MRMTDLTLNDLHNPYKITAILVYRTDDFIEAADNQGFQETPGKIELWQKMNDGRLLRVQAWRKTSVATYG